MPTFGVGDVDALIVSLGTVMSGILTFFVDGAALWLTLAAALMIIGLFKRFLGLRRA